MPELPFPDPPAPHPHPDEGGGIGWGRPVSPPNVWLCAERPGGSGELGPLWARRVIRALTERNERVIVRALRGYPGLAADAAALLRVAGATGRLPVALMPTVCSAARTRTLLRAVPTHTTHQATNHEAATESRSATAVGVATAAVPAIEGCAATRGCPDTVGVAADTERAAIVDRAATADCVAGGAATDELTDRGHTAATGGPGVAAAGELATHGQPPVTDEVAVTGHRAVNEGFPVTDRFAVAEASATTGPATTGTETTEPGWPVPAIVGVGRRRAGVEHGPAAAVIVLAGPVAADARLPRRTMPSARVLGQWARVLEPAGVLGVLSPPPVGRHRAPGGRWEGSPVPGLAEVGLSWTDHLVLVHAPTRGNGADTGLDHPERPRRPELPFVQTHTCLDLFEPAHFTDATALADPWATR